MQIFSDLNWWHLAITAFVSAGGSAICTKYLSRIVKAMPPLPLNAGFWKSWAYWALKGITEAEPEGQPKV